MYERLRRKLRRLRNYESGKNDYFDGYIQGQISILDDILDDMTGNEIIRVQDPVSDSNDFNGSNDSQVTQIATEDVPVDIPVDIPTPNIDISNRPNVEPVIEEESF